MLISDIGVKPLYPIHRSLKYESLQLQSEGKICQLLKYEVFQIMQALILNLPEMYKHTIFYRECDILNFIKNIKGVSKIKIIGRDIVNNSERNVRSLVLKVSC